MSSILNKLFDKIYCINLNKRTDRWQEMLVQFKRYNIDVERFPAIEGNKFGWHNEKYTAGKAVAFNGACGCIASHLAIYKLAKQNGYKSILIIEDDCDFENDLNNVFNFRYKQVPADWDLLYFGGVHETMNGQFKPEPLGKHVMIGKRIITTTCYAAKNTVYDLMINTLERDLPFPYTAIDGYLASEIQPKCKTYAFHPPIAWQRASHSDIQLGHRDYVNMMRFNNIR
jgi:GR25 family glycosyltransferase involved in LPS biosynthesis